MSYCEFLRKIFWSNKNQNILETYKQIIGIESSNASIKFGSTYG